MPLIPNNSTRSSLTFNATTKRGAELAVAPSSAEAFYQQIVNSTDPLAFIRTMVDPSSPLQEEEWLEFKGGKNPQAGTAIPDGDVDKYWSKALSGFANTGGGVLIWGIDARPDPTTRIERADSLSHVINPLKFKTRLNQLSQHSNDPPVIGVSVNEYQDPANPGEGFIVCFIPESSFKPHRAKKCTGEPYYIRIGDRFEIVPHPLLRQLFFPQLHARFELDVGIDWRNSVKQSQLKIQAALINVGTRTAKDVFVVVQGAPKLELSPFPFWKKTGSLIHNCIAFEAGRSIHPGATSPLFSAEHSTAATVLDKGHSPAVVPDQSGLNFFVQIYAADEEPQHILIQFDAEEVRNRINKKASSEIGNLHRLPELWHQFSSP